MSHNLISLIDGFSECMILVISVDQATSTKFYVSQAQPIHKT